MSEFQEKNDKLLDQNLRNLSRRVHLPSLGSASVSGRRPGQSAQYSELSTADRSARPPRWFAVFGSAAAAVFVMCGFLLAPGGARHVEAATIWRTLRETLHNGFRLELRDVRLEKISIGGRIDVLFDKPIKLIDLIESQDAQEPSRVFCELSIDAAEDADEVGGMQLRAAGTYQPDEKWLFARLDRFPSSLAVNEPLLNLLAPVLHRGILLDASNLDLAGFFRTASIDASPGPAITQPASLSTSSKAPDAPPHADNALTGLTQEQESSADQALRAVLSGTLKREDFPQIIVGIESLAQDTKVEQALDGAWVLTARNFRLPDVDSEDAALLRQAALRVEYVEGDGIRLAELTHVGESDGTIRFGFISRTDVRVLNRKQFEADGATVIDRELLTFFSRMSGR